MPLCPLIPFRPSFPGIPLDPGSPGTPCLPVSPRAPFKPRGTSIFLFFLLPSSSSSGYIITDTYPQFQL